MFVIYSAVLKKKAISGRFVADSRIKLRLNVRHQTILLFNYVPVHWVNYEAFFAVSGLSSGANNDKLEAQDVFIVDVEILSAGPDQAEMA